jgi:xanthine dehydrogenase iron-sulfur cluster and FAD-binding subunit A
MPSLAYHAPASVDEAVALLSANPGAMPLAGGTDLIVQMRSGARVPGAIVDLKRIAQLSGVRRHGDNGFAIGAATPCTALREDAALAAAWPGVVESANLIGSVQVRNRATMGGNLCNASPAADSVPALIAAGATCLIAGPNGEREVPVEKVATGPGSTSLAPGEFVVDIRLPAQVGGGGDAYLRSIPRTETDRRRAHRAAGRGGRRGADRHQARRCRARGDGPGRQRRLQADRRQARHQEIPYRHGGRARQAHCPDCPRAGGSQFMSKIHVTTTVNGDEREFLCTPGETLLDALRGQLGLTGSKEGCGSGDCGACTVVLDGQMVCSCLVLAAEAEGRTIATIEGVAEGSELHPVQQTFLERGALQCGFCTPGFIVAAKALLDHNPAPSESEIRYWLAGNLCRCTGYDKIVRAVQDAAAQLRQERTPA